MILIKSDWQLNRCGNWMKKKNSMTTMQTDVVHTAHLASYAAAMLSPIIEHRFLPNANDMFFFDKTNIVEPADCHIILYFWNKSILSNKDGDNTHNTMYVKDWSNIMKERKENINNSHVTISLRFYLTRKSRFKHNWNETNIVDWFHRFPFTFL